jgi:phosphoribosylanthranilate isomerase
MALKLSVKIGDVTNLSDARYAAGMGVDYIGFNINSTSENFVGPKVFKEIVNWISGVGIIGEIGTQKINSTSSEDQYPSYLMETSNANIASTNEEFVFRIDATKLTNDDLEKLLAQKENILFFILEVTADQLKNNSLFLAQLCASRPIYFSTNFDEILLDTIITSIKPKGIEIKGGLEDQPGFKDYDGIADVLEWLEEDD